MSSGITHIKVEDQGFTSVMDENGEFRCPHINAAVINNFLDRTYEVYCPDCMNEDLTKDDVENLIDLHIHERES